MDILTLDTEVACNESIGLELLSPVDAQGTGIFIYLVGKDSEACQNHTREQIDDTLRKAHRAKQRGKDMELQTSAKLKERELNFLVACTTGWCQFQTEDKTLTKPYGDKKDTISYGDEELAFTPANVKKLYKRLPWITTQVDEAIGDLSLFMRN